MTDLDRFILIPEERLMAPGCCMVCNSITGDFIDFLFDQDFYGAVYFCISCIKQAGLKIGLVPINILESMQKEMNSLIATLKQKDITIKEMKDANDSYKHVISDMSVSINTEPFDDTDNKEYYEGNDIREKRFIEQDNEQRPYDTSYSDKSLRSFGLGETI